LALDNNISIKMKKVQNKNSHPTIDNLSYFHCGKMSKYYRNFSH